MPLETLLKLWIDNVIKGVKDVPVQARELRRLKSIEDTMNIRLTRTFLNEDFKPLMVGFSNIFHSDFSEPPVCHDVAPAISLAFDAAAPRIICRYQGLSKREWLYLPDSFFLTRLQHVDSPPQDHDTGFITIREQGRMHADELWNIQAEIARMLEEKIERINPNLIYRFRNARHVEAEPAANPFY